MPYKWKSIPTTKCSVLVYFNSWNEDTLIKVQVSSPQWLNILEGVSLHLKVAKEQFVPKTTDSIASIEWLTQCLTLDGPLTSILQPQWPLAHNSRCLMVQGASYYWMHIDSIASVQCMIVQYSAGWTKSTTLQLDLKNISGIILQLGTGERERE